ncbi:uncharacterized protein [Littorina saxatilis]|uniref:Protein kinase domain-containing protein n=1 Tax=Littorina saxatilis TaxID=31220 RepID=A0AAN9AVD1_9CAEN
MDLPCVEDPPVDMGPRRRGGLGTATSAGNHVLHKVFSELKGRSGKQVFERNVDLNDMFRLQKKVGSGGFSEVWLARYRHKARLDPVAIKLIPQKQCSNDMVVNEVSILKSLLHTTFIVQMVSCFRTSTYYAIVMKYATRGNLHERVKMVRCFSEMVARFYAAEIAEGLFVLHEKGIIHRDLNLDNVLVCESGHVVLSDFGLSLQRDPAIIDEPCEPWLEGAGKPQFPPPEVFMNQTYDKTADWWAFGVILYRMVCGYFPFVRSRKRSRDSSAYDLQLVYRPEQYPSFLSRPAVEVISRLLMRRKESRLGGGKLEENAIASTMFFYHVDWGRVRDMTVPVPFTELLDPKHISENYTLYLPVSYVGSEKEQISAACKQRLAVVPEVKGRNLRLLALNLKGLKGKDGKDTAKQTLAMSKWAVLVNPRLWFGKNTRHAKKATSKIINPNDIFNW